MAAGSPRGSPSAVRKSFFGALSRDRSGSLESLSTKFSASAEALERSVSQRGSNSGLERAGKGPPSPADGRSKAGFLSVQGLESSRSSSLRGSSEAVPSGPVSFREENGLTTTMDYPTIMQSVLLENPETETRWYFKYFLGHVHKNFALSLADTRSRGAVVQVLLSVLGDMSRAILWQKEGSERLLLNLGTKKLFDQTTQRRPLDVKKILQEFGQTGEIKKSLDIKDADLQDQLLVLEEQEGAVNFKIGVLYAKAGQMTDDDMFSNEGASQDFVDFYSLLGTVRPLAGWTAFRGGLDVRTGLTGEHFVHTVEHGKEIVFHVSTLLPHSKGNSQQLERKRHLGNDICNIVYQEDPGTLFAPELIKSQFNHIFAVVTRQRGTGYYTLKVFSKSSVPEYGPTLPNPAVFVDAQDLRRFLLVKLMNGEKAALSSPTASFAQKKHRTLELLIQAIHDHYKESRQKPSGESFRAESSGADREAEFRHKGQSLKLQKIVAGAAPTSTLSSEPSAPAAAVLEPWTPLCITTDFPHMAMCGSPSEKFFVIGTSAGIFRVLMNVHEPGRLQKSHLVDASLRSAKIQVVEEIEMLFVLTSGSSGDSKDENNLFGIPFAVLADDGSPLTRKRLKEFQVPGTKICQNFVVSKPNFAEFSTCTLVLACGKSVRVMQFTPENPGNVPGMGMGGQYSPMQELACADTVDSVCLDDDMACFGLRSGEFVFWNLSTGASFSSPSSGAGFVASVVATAVPARGPGNPSEFILTSNQVSVFRWANGAPSRTYEIRWNAVPQTVVHVAPYILAFSRDTIEIATLINGKLVKTLQLPAVRFFSQGRGVFFGTQQVGGPMSLFVIPAERLSGSGSNDFGPMEHLKSHMAGSAVVSRKLSSAEL